MTVRIVIGKNFGDEGQGLAVDFFASQSPGRSVICVRHNGGAQAGHTVDRPDFRFVFLQLSSGSLRGADTYWADSFLPDLYKLSEETERFASAGRRLPQIFASPRCRCTYPGDVLLNMLLETSRGADRHGSCGMGINEAVVRSEQYPLYLGHAAGQPADALFRRMRTLKNDYLPQRLRELHIDLKTAGEYGELLQSETLLRNAAEVMARNAAALRLCGAEHLTGYDDVIFEGAQGLLLDSEYTAYAPHLTSSRTGLHEPARIVNSVLPCADAEIVYVTRTYVTRHGAGPLPRALPAEQSAFLRNDRTNVPNPWQGTLRAAAHGDAADFVHAVRGDLADNPLNASVSLFVTHLNETDGCMLTDTGRIPAETYCRADALRTVFARVYYSDSPYAENVRCADFF